MVDNIAFLVRHAFINDTHRSLVLEQNEKIICLFVCNRSLLLDLPPPSSLLLISSSLSSSSSCSSNRLT
jgi:hypothetical protein